MQKVNEGQHHECKCISIKISICIHIKILTNSENTINAIFIFRLQQAFKIQEELTSVLKKKKVSLDLTTPKTEKKKKL